MAPEANGSDTPKRSKVEYLKEASRGLYGAIAADLAENKPDFSDESVQILKHHGSYQQDDRDTRTERKKAGLGRDYKMMVRTKFPGGAISAEQYLLCDELAEKYGQGDLRVTSRQDFQFHGVVRGNFRPLIHDLNLLGKMTTLGGCGDVVRNTMAPPVADIDLRYKDCGTDLLEMARRVSAHFLPTTTSYYDLWLDDEKVTVNPDGTLTYTFNGNAQAPDDPLYKTTYLPRKFKIAFATDFDNSVDAYANDIGVIAATENGKIVGYEVLAGGGLGYTHRKPATYARIASPVAYVSEPDLLPLLEAIVKVQRDFGGREDRRRARLKYLIDDWGMDQFRAKVYEYAGRAFDLPRGIEPAAQPDYLGWHREIRNGYHYVGVWIENGRIRDFEGGFKFRTGLRRIIESYKPGVRLTPHHNIILSGIADADVDAVQALLDEYGLPTDKGISQIRRLEMACPALPLCGLAMAESERAMPAFIHALEDAGHGDADVLIRMSGCPNNCSRPRTAEIGIVGSGADRYIIYTGGDFLGRRMCDELIEKIPLAGLGPIVSTLLTAWKSERADGERFGDWSHRVGVETLRARIEGVAAAL